jgi:[glutamine synthetase] adenylyltransferase / [glutamine synthetase]-adenylyl-L-tyrosine phosphorylase
LTQHDIGDQSNTWTSLGTQRLLELGLTDANLRGQAVRVLGASDYVFKTLEGDSSLRELIQTKWLTKPLNAQAYTDEATAITADCSDEATLMHVLRKMRKRHMVRLGWRDIGQLAQFDDVVAETSWLADAIIDTALSHLHEWAVKRRGTPRDSEGNEQHLIVLALGKLGAGELNFSSDIDLIFAFANSGETDCASRTESNDEFFTRLARRLIHVLDTVDKDGFVFRVDMRLRPFGNSGPLVTSTSAVERYYETHGRDWERYALIRARVVAGDKVEGESLLRDLQPFIYRRYLDFGALESIREMKALINIEVRREGLQDNVKIGPGGIREVEFIAQAFQLVRGGRMPVLRRREVRPVLQHLAEHGLLPGHAARDLYGAYEFLRTLEHRLQQVDDQQTHTIGAGSEGRERLAFAMGYTSWYSLSTVLNGHRSHVREHFDQIFGTTADDSGVPEEPDALGVLLGGPVAEDGSQMMRLAGFGDAAEATYEPVRKLLLDQRVRLLSERAHKRFMRLMPDLLRAASGTAAPATTTERLCDVIQTIAQRSVYLSLLVERPLALSQLVRLCAGSALIAAHIRQFPLVIDELLDPRTLYNPLRKPALESQFEERLSAVQDGDLEQEMETLRREKQTNLLRVAAADLAKVLPLMVVSDHLTEIAEVCVDRALTLAWRDVTARHGEPSYRVGDTTVPASFAVIAYGKLGGLELSYGSDLDLVYLHGSHGEAQVTDGNRVVDNEVFFARMAQRLVHILTARTLSGILYEVDLRLRPSGASGLMVTSLTGFANYQRNEAWTWEHQALVRARVICGDEQLAQGFADVRAEILLRPRDEAALRTEVREMRQRMRAELATSAEDSFDLKQGEGGIADIEFLVQYLVLRSAKDLGDHLQFTDNIRLLEGMEANAVLPTIQTQVLADAYRAYRTRVHGLALQSGAAIVPTTEFADMRAAVTRIWNEIMEER